jgi:hypothetical protein
VALRGRCQDGVFVAWQGNGMACVNQTRQPCVNQMGMAQSKPVAERQGRCESALELCGSKADSVRSEVQIT